MPQRRRVGLSDMSSLVKATISSSFLFVSRRVAPSGAMSRSWKQKKGMESFSVSSKTARSRSRATSIGSDTPSQGLCMVPSPKGSLPVPVIVCQKAMEKRRLSFWLAPSLPLASGS